MILKIAFLSQILVLDDIELDPVDELEIGRFFIIPRVGHLSSNIASKYHTRTSPSHNREQQNFAHIFITL